MTANPAVSRLIGTGSSEKREKDDFYSTPKECTEELLRHETFTGSIWEPACGDGAISRVLDAAGHIVVSTDLVDRGFGLPRVDFLMEQKRLADNIITNPPFKNAADFVRKALDLSTGKVAMLLKLAFLEGQDRSDVLEGGKLETVYVFRNRAPLNKNGEDHSQDSGMLALAWFVWNKSYSGLPQIKRITIPKPPNPVGVELKRNIPEFANHFSGDGPAEKGAA
jgi:hypothetical protein